MWICLVPFAGSFLKLCFFVYVVWASSNSCFDTETAARNLNDHTQSDDSSLPHPFEMNTAGYSHKCALCLCEDVPQTVWKTELKNVRKTVWRIRGRARKGCVKKSVKKWVKKKKLSFAMWFFSRIFSHTFSRTFWHVFPAHFLRTSAHNSPCVSPLDFLAVCSAYSIDPTPWPYPPWPSTHLKWRGRHWTRSVSRKPMWRIVCRCTCTPRGHFIICKRLGKKMHQPVLRIRMILHGFSHGQCT